MSLKRRIKKIEKALSKEEDEHDAEILYVEKGTV